MATKIVRVPWNFYELYFFLHSHFSPEVRAFLNIDNRRRTTNSDEDNDDSSNEVQIESISKYMYIES